MLFLTPSEMIAIRDPRGFRPLALGRLGDAWVVAVDGTTQNQHSNKHFAQRRSAPATPVTLRAAADAYVRDGTYAVLARANA